MNNNMTPITNPKLREAMKELKNGSEEAFVRELLHAKLLCPALVEGMPNVKPGSGPVKVEGKMKMYILNASNNKSYLMAYTDIEEMHKWRKQEGEQVMIWGLPQYAGVLLKDECPHAGFVINPFSENVIIKKEFIEKIGRNLRPVNKPIVLGDDEEELLTDTSAFPEGLVQALCDYMNQSGDVLRAYLTDMVKEDEQDFLLVVETTENPKYLFPCITNAAEPFLGEKKMNVVPFGTELAKAVTKDMKPIFIKDRN